MRAWITDPSVTNQEQPQNHARRFFGRAEAVFNVAYLTAAVALGFVLLGTRGNDVRPSAGLMALVLAGGDAFHLVPRIVSILISDQALDERKESLQRHLGRGKQIASITMTLFYVVLWHIGVRILHTAGDSFLTASRLLYIASFTRVFYALAGLRIFLCLLPQNEWTDSNPPLFWGTARNIPFFFQGLMTSILFFQLRTLPAAPDFLWLAVVLSFVFYLPVVLWVHKRPAVGMLMLPKTCTYLWMLAMFL